MGGIELILVKAGLADEEKLNSESRTAEFFGIAPGHLIVGSKHVSDEAVLVALRLNSLLVDEVITLTQAAQIARLIIKHNKTWNDAMLTVTGTLGKQEVPKLGELLINAGLITPLQAASAMITAERKGIALGEAFINTGLLSKIIVVRALALQDCIRDRRLSSMLAAGQLRFNSISTNNQHGTLKRAA